MTRLAPWWAALVVTLTLLIFAFYLSTAGRFEGLVGSIVGFAAGYWLPSRPVAGGAGTDER